jgi:GNAT superfamily N-acetyltransferase
MELIPTVSLGAIEYGLLLVIHYQNHLLYDLIHASEVPMKQQATVPPARHHGQPADAEGRVAANRSASAGNQQSAAPLSQIAQKMRAGPLGVAQRAFIESIHNSPRMLAQRRQFDALRGPANSVAPVLQAVWENDPDRRGWFRDSDLKLRYEAATNRFYYFSGGRRLLPTPLRQQYVQEILALAAPAAPVPQADNVVDGTVVADAPMMAAEIQAPGAAGALAVHPMLGVAAPAAAAAPALIITVTGNTIEARVGGQLSATFKLAQHDDHVGGSLYLTHMLIEPAYKRQGLGRRLLETAVAQFGVFRVGTPQNMEFFRPVDTEDAIALTEEGDCFIEKMLGEGVINHNYVFPMDHRAAYAAMFAAGDSDGSQSDTDGSGSGAD